MKLVIGGPTGFVGTEIIRQALRHPDVTSVVALGRREFIVPSGEAWAKGDASKLKSVVLNDFENYPEDVKNELAGCDAVIWTIAITPRKMRSMTFEEISKISMDYATTAIKEIASLPRDPAAKPLRFTYMSGVLAERDQTKKPLLLGQLVLMRGEAENRILAYAQQSNGAVEACIAKSARIENPNSGVVGKTVALLLQPLAGRISLPIVAAAVLDQSLHGFEKDTLFPEDMERIGQKALVVQKG